MDGDDFGRLIYLVLLGAVIGGYFFVSNRDRLGETARQAALWVLIFVGTIIGVGLWGDLKDTLVPSQALMNGSTITVPRGPDGHYHLTLDVGDVPVDFIVDTGATQIVINQADAKRIGIDTDRLIYGGRAMTANGEVRTAAITLDNVSVEGLPQGDLRATVNEGELGKSLLGMHFLERFERVEISGDTLILEQ